MIIFFIITTYINCFILHTTQTVNKYITFPFDKTTRVYSKFAYAIISSSISIGTPPQCIQVSFASQLYSTFIFDKEYNGNGFSAKNSNSFISKDEDIFGITFRDLFHYVKLSYDSFYVPNNQLPFSISLPFYYDVTYNNFDCNGGIIGTNLHKDKTSFDGRKMNSLLNVLYKQQLISHETVSVDYNKQIIVFGKEINQHKEHLKMKCNCEENKWMCMLRNFNNIGVLLGNDTQSTANKILFMFESEFTVCPELYFNFIQNVYLKHEFDNQICKVAFTETIQQYYITCNDNMNINKLPPLTFEFHNQTNTLILTPQELFLYNEDNNFVFLFRYYINTKHWIFGCSFLNQTNTTIHFDFHDKRIYIFNNKSPFPKHRHHHYYIIIPLIKLNTYINIICFMLLLFTYVYLNRNIKFK